MRKNSKIILSIVILILIDQFIKIYILRNFMNEEFSVIGNMVIFKPIINNSYSWINSITNMGIGLVPHIIFSGMVLIISIIILNFVKVRYFDNNILKCFFSFWISGGFCSLIDRVFWGGSLDYIKLNGFFTFDLKDVYLTIGESIVLISIIFNYKKLKNLDEKIIYNDFKLYIKSKGIKK